MKSRYFYFDHGQYGQKEEEVAGAPDDGLLVRTSWTLVSVGTEVHCNTGLIPWSKGRHGYSNVGRVLEVGRAVSGFAVGDRVFSFRPHVDYYAGSLSQPWFTAYLVPADLADEDATFCTLATVALHAVERAAAPFGASVVVVGQGTLGQLVAQLARIAGAGVVIGVDPDPKRRELSSRLGVDSAIEPEAEALKQALSRGPRQRPPSVFIEATGSAAALPWMIEAGEIGSRIVVTGSFTEGVTIDPLRVVEQELEIVGAHQPKDSESAHRYYPYNRPFNITHAMELIRSKRLAVKPLADAVIRPEDLLAFYDAAKAGNPRPSQPIVRWS